MGFLLGSGHFRLVRDASEENVRMLYSVYFSIPVCHEIVRIYCSVLVRNVFSIEEKIY